MIVSGTAFMPQVFTNLATYSFLSNLNMAFKEGHFPIIIGVAADSGCGKTTFMHRLTTVLGGDQVGPLGGGIENGGWETNTLVSKLTTVICLDDYHVNDRVGRRNSGLTALNVVENNFELMYDHLKALKNGEKIYKPIYNHINGTLDKPEEIVPTPIIIIEGLHPMHDERVRKLLDFTLYLDISDKVKLNWKIKRDMKDRGHSLLSILTSIEARRVDLEAYVLPQKKVADFIIEVLPTELNPQDIKTVRVRAIQKEGVPHFTPSYIFDLGSIISWVPPIDKLSSHTPGVSFYSGPEDFMGKKTNVIEMDGSFNNISEVLYLESSFKNIHTKFYGEFTKAMMALADAPGSNDGTGIFQTVAIFAIRALYEKKTGIPIPPM